MGLFARSLGCLALVLVPAVALAQGAGSAPAAPPAAPAPSGSAPAPGPAGGSSDAAADSTPKSTGSVGGVSFNDKPARRAPVARAAAPRRSGPIATFPGFEQLGDGGSRLHVNLDRSVPIEERRAAGSVTYVLKGAHLRVKNDANALVTVHFNTPVVRARLAPQGNDLLFILELRSAVSPTFKVQENPDKTSTLQIDFAKGDFLPGDGSEALPSAAAGKPGAARRGARGANGTTPATPPPATPDANEPGPNP